MIIFTVSDCNEVINRVKSYFIIVKQGLDYFNRTLNKDKTNFVAFSLTKAGKAPYTSTEIADNPKMELKPVPATNT